MEIKASAQACQLAQIGKFEVSTGQIMLSLIGHAARTLLLGCVI